MMVLDNEYKQLVEHILTSEEFLNLKKCEHHGITRFDHSLKVSYQAYKSMNNCRNFAEKALTWYF